MSTSSCCSHRTCCSLLVSLSPCSCCCHLLSCPSVSNIVFPAVPPVVVHTFRHEAALKCWRQRHRACLIFPTFLHATIPNSCVKKRGKGSWRALHSSANLWPCTQLHNHMPCCQPVLRVRFLAPWHHQSLIEEEGWGSSTPCTAVPVCASSTSPESGLYSAAGSAIDFMLSNTPMKNPPFRNQQGFVDSCLMTAIKGLEVLPQL